MPEVLAYDPLSPEVMSNPFPTYAALRETAPVQYYAGLSIPYYILFRHEDVIRAETDTDYFTAAYGSSAMYRNPTAMQQDGPRHLAFRMLAQARFSPRSLARYRSRIEGFVQDLLDDMLSAGPPGEIYSQLALELPVRTTVMLLGADPADKDELGYLADKLMLLGWIVAPQEEYQQLRDRVMVFFNKLIDDRLAALADAGIDDPNPSHVGAVVPDDITSDVICGRVEGSRVTRQEMLDMLQVFLVGGIDTTAHLITNCIWRLLEDRTLWEQVKADPERLIPAAIEESLRFDPPGLGLWRTTAQEIEMHGRRIPAHAKVQMSYGSANRDPRVFSDPDTFRLDRPPSESKRHLTFGAGPHTCIGQHLSRLEMTLVLQALFARMPDLRLAGETERVENFGCWGRRRLPVAW